MATQVQFRGGTTTAHGSFTGAAREVTVDTDKDTVVIHDGSTAGGFPLLREDGSNSALALGSQGSPSLKFTGDTNTGIYSPGADQVAISTGGTGRLFIDASGRVGIGTTSPQNKFNVVSSGVGYEVDQTSLANTNLLLSYDRAASTYRSVANYYGGTYIWNDGGTERLRITSTGTLMHLGAGNSATPAVQFNGSAPVNSLVIDSTGKVGLGTSAPSSVLEAKGLSAGSAVGTFISNETDSDTPLVVFQRFGGAVAGAINYKATTSPLRLDIGTTTNHNFGIYTNNTIAVTVDNSQNVGIGSTSPGSLLEVNGKTVVGSTSSDALEVFSSGDTEIGFSYDTRGNIYAKIIGDITNASPLAGEIAFQTATGGSLFERARLDSSGRLLVGTTSDSKDSSLVLQGNSGSSTAAGVIRLARGTSTPANGDDLGFIFFGDNSHGSAASIKTQRDGGTWTSGSSEPGRLVFSTNAGSPDTGPTERMRIASDGHTYWTTGAPSTTAFGTSISRAGVLGFIESFRNGNGTNVTAQFGGNSGYAQVMGDGDLENTNNSYTGLSDIKLKENIVDANSQWDDLKAFQVRNYNFKAETGFNTHTQIGLIAQEVELVSPGLVGESIDDETGESTKSVNYSVLYMKAVKALQEAMERIEQLEAKVAALEAQ